MDNKAINRFEQLNIKNGKYLLAFSGGPDSIYALEMLRIYLKDKLNKHIYLCYVNYHDSPYVDEEEKIVYHYVKKYDLKIYRTDTKFNKSKDKNFEDWARQFRYRYFKKTIKDNNLDGLITGHHLTDLIETYLLQKNRGNLPLYYGLPLITTLNGIKLLRPLIDITKKEIYQYLEDNNLLYYEDITNQDQKKERNRLRKSGFSDEEIASYQQEIKSLNTKLALLYYVFADNYKEVDYSFYNSLDEEKQKRLIFYILDKNGIKNRREGIAKDIYYFVKKEQSGEYKINDKFTLYKTKNFFFVSDKYSNVNYLMHCDKEIKYENRYFSIDLKDIKQFNLKSLPVTIRNFRPGDQIATNLPTKDVYLSLKKQQVPSYLINIYPVFIQNDKIVCVPFYKDILEHRINFKFKKI